ncbi:hypothetical protein L5515_012184 [Caenorhabditis briggsae]|uniref:Sugar phosphate phosphatase n=1 Tax=Caenorhabditis briggsae TaxID=6238 RepID=A0AAE9JGQ5_CAEBR|nr:hypothetical protein L5515_012184 [Caenorhabditis briggsae]
MGIVDEFDHVAPRLRGKKEGTFAYFTVRDRWPKIVTSLVDQLTRKRDALIEKHGEDASADIADILEKFSRLRYEIMTDKPLINFPESGPDGKMWHDWMEELKTAVMPNDVEELTYFKGPWLFVECYLYRFIYSAFLATKKLADMDYFEDSKRKNFLDHLDQVEEGVAFLMKITAKDSPAHEMFGIHQIMKSSLWGNRADMSLTGGDDHTMFQKMSSIAASVQLKDYILIDDVNWLMVKVLAPLQANPQKLKNRRIDIVLDNAGVELCADLMMAEFFLARGFADKVVLHGKAIPWFVSDTTENDFNWTVDSLHLAGQQSAKLGEQIKKRVEKREIIYKADLFWISPHPYCDMQEKAPELYEELTTSSLVIFKGDLNYRKLVGDRDWDLNTSFKKAVRGFDPCPILALRTLKAETIAGLTDEVLNILLEKFDEDNSWMTSGEYAVCQLGGVPPIEE